MRTLYHSTSPENAEAIRRDGFLEGEPVLYPGGVQRHGQFVSDTPIPRRSGDVVLAIEWDGSQAELEHYDRTRMPNANDYFEWHVPAARLNRCVIRVA